MEREGSGPGPVPVRWHVRGRSHAGRQLGDQREGPGVRPESRGGGSGLCSPPRSLPTGLEPSAVFCPFPGAPSPVPLCRCPYGVMGNLRGKRGFNWMSFRTFGVAFKEHLQKFRSSIQSTAAACTVPATPPACVPAPGRPLLFRVAPSRVQLPWRKLNHQLWFPVAEPGHDRLAQRSLATAVPSEAALAVLRRRPAACADAACRVQRGLPTVPAGESARPLGLPWLRLEPCS